MEDRHPVAIGGVGGSGTRLIAGIARAAGYWIGSDSNDASDTLWFTLLFKHAGALDWDDDDFRRAAFALRSGLTGGAPLDAGSEALLHSLCAHDRSVHPASWLQARADSLLAAARAPAHGGPWGWKEPNTHMLVERLWRHLPTLRYVHVVRDGVDMAYSRNQQQLQLWGPRILGADGPPTPRRSLSFWCHVHRRMQRLRAEHPQRVFWLDYDALCREPATEAGKLCAWLGCDLARVAPILQQVRAPTRRTGIDLRELDPDDVAYAQSLCDAG